VRALLAVVLALAPPTKAERVALTSAMRGLQGEVAIQKITVARSDRRYAVVRWGFKVAQSDTLFERRGGRWRVVLTRPSDRPADGACAFVPTGVVRELFGIACPGFAALHGRPATTAELNGMEAAFRKSPFTRYWRDAKRLSDVCVSRLDASWAAARAAFPDTSGVIWFRHRRRWTVAYESLFGGGALPPPKIVLSLAACAGYNAAEYSG
jgi:hypothetical protein